MATILVRSTRPQVPLSQKGQIARETAGATEHLTEDEVLAFLERRAPDSVEAHLAVCPGCRNLVRLLAGEDSPSQRTLVDARSGTEPMAPDGVVMAPSNVMRRVAEARIGECLGEKWTLERLLGIGGSAFVYAARHRNGRLMAIKILRPELAFAPAVVEHFLQEGRVASQIPHRGALAILDDGHDAKGTPYLVMELLDGQSLRDRLDRSGPLPWKEVHRLLDGALEVVAAAHARGIVHRDLKPENLFVTNDGVVRVLDFGLARVREGLLDPAGVALGTRGYMPPEQARGEWHLVGPDADVWALATTAIVLLTGRMPEEGKESIRGVPGFARALLERALAPAPGARFASAQEMLAELRRGRTARTRRRTLLAITGGLVVLLGLVLAWQKLGAARPEASVERAAVMNTLRERLRPELPGKDFVFDVSPDVFAGELPIPGQYNASGEWVFLFGRIESRLTGQALDYRGTAWDAGLQAGTMFDHVEALLRKKSGRWSVVAWDIGSTDSRWLRWTEHGAPATIFPKEPLPVGQAERAAVMEAVRETLRPELAGQDVAVDVRANAMGATSATRGHYGAADQSVFLLGTLANRDTEHVEALVTKATGRWLVERWAIGGREVVYPAWTGAAPHGIFPSR